MTDIKVFNKYGNGKTVVSAIIGAGYFGTSIITQCAYIKQLRFAVVADINLDNAVKSFVKSGIDKSRIVCTRDPQEAQRVISEGKYVCTDDTMMIMDIPAVDVVCECTGNPEAGARHCRAAIDKGKHVAAVNKEMDATVGPVLSRLAERNGVSYSPVDGDQPALAMAMTEWARLTGLHVISVGKACDAELIYDDRRGSVSLYADGITVLEDYTVPIPEGKRKFFEKIPAGACAEYISEREEVLRGIPGAGNFDLCELVIMANALGLHPQRPETIGAPLRTCELPIAYCEKKHGGLFTTDGVIDLHRNLHRADESGMGGGVYITVRCDNKDSNHVLTTKGAMSNSDGSASVLYRPYHLCGLEIATTILSQGLLGLDTGALSYEHSFDLARCAARDIKMGEVFGNDHDEKLKAIIVPALKRDEISVIPAHMSTGNRARVDIKAGEMITYDMVEEPKGSVLWELRAIQEAL